MARYPEPKSRAAMCLAFLPTTRYRCHLFLNHSGEHRAYGRDGSIHSWPDSESREAVEHRHNPWTCDPMFDVEGLSTNPYLDGNCPRPQDYETRVSLSVAVAGVLQKRWHADICGCEAWRTGACSYGLHAPESFPPIEVLEALALLGYDHFEGER